MEIGLTYTSRLVVSTDHVAAVMGSGDLHVFATPAMVALMENAAMLAVAGHLPEGSTTVGAMMNTSHVKPSPVDETIQATAVLTGGIIQRAPIGHIASYLQMSLETLSRVRSGIQ